MSSTSFCTIGTCCSYRITRAPTKGTTRAASSFILSPDLGCIPKRDRDLHNPSKAQSKQPTTKSAKERSRAKAVTPAPRADPSIYVHRAAPRSMCVCAAVWLVLPGPPGKCKSLVPGMPVPTAYRCAMVPSPTSVIGKAAAKPCWKEAWEA